MTQEATTPTGSDLTQGIAPTDLVDRKLVAHVGDQDVLAEWSNVQISPSGEAF
jgi:hypothetical protein